MTNEHAPPDADEIEVSLFGPGYGECVVIHAGDGEWLIVDSCWDSANSFHPALDYLERIGVDPGQAVSSIVATHWHDDHIAGMAVLVERCAQADFYLPITYNLEELLTWAELATDEFIGRRTGLREIRGVVDALLARDPASPSRTPRYVLSGRKVVDCARDFGTVDLSALAPSDEVVYAAQRSLAAHLSQHIGVAVPPTVIGSPAKNEGSVVLWLRAGKRNVLLGGDLEIDPSAASGWQAVVDARPADAPPCDVYKVSHHGSENGDDDLIWQELLTEEPLAIVAPFSNGAVSLPTDNGLARLCSRTPNVYLTSPPGPGGKRRRRAAVERSLREITRSGLRPVEQPWGQIRLRRSAVDEAGVWGLELIRGAVSAC